MATRHSWRGCHSVETLSSPVRAALRVGAPSEVRDADATQLRSQAT